MSIAMILVVMPDSEKLHANYPVEPEVSNWGRWGTDDELGAANLITAAKRKQALALAREGLTVSLAHDIIQAAAPDGASYLDRAVLNVSPTGAADRYQYTGTYHGSVHSHLDALDCHVMYAHGARGRLRRYVRNAED